MRSVENLLKQLSKVPKNAMCYAYEGEGSGILICWKGHSAWVDMSEEFVIEKKRIEIIKTDMSMYDMWMKERTKKEGRS